MNEFTTLMNTLDTALSLKRGHGSETEARFVAWLSKQVCPTLIDGGGNIHVELGSSRTIFTAHTDSVHHEEGENKIRKTLTYWHAEGAALGADDGCGIALMLHMIAAGVPGRYIFFRGEECGGIGSGWLAAEMPQLLKRYDRAIAFDRAGLGDVITHQSGGRCCSDVFANALADAMNINGLMYMPDSTGVYTDTAEFTHIIPECTNLSVGYEHQHGDREELNLLHFVAVAEVVTKIDWEALPTSRDPKVKEPRYSRYGKAPAGSAATTAEFDNWMAGVYDTTAYMYDPDEAEITDAAIGAVLAAMDDRDFRVLLDILSETIYPQDPALARKHIKISDLTNERLLVALESLEIDTVDTVMLALYDSMPVYA